MSVDFKNPPIDLEMDDEKRMPMRSTTGRMTTRLYFNLGRCSVWRIITFSITLVFAWLLLTWTRAADVIYSETYDAFRFRLSESMQSAEDVPDDSLEIDVGVGSAGGDGPAVILGDDGKYVHVGKDPAVVQDYLSLENPLSTYFNDELGGEAPLAYQTQSPDKVYNHVPLKMALIFLQDLESSTATQITAFFEQQRMEYRTARVFDELPSLILKGTKAPMFSLFVFDEYVTYLTMDPSKKAVIDEYCRTYFVGIFALTESSRNGEIEYFSDLKLKLQHRMSLDGYKLNAESSIWRVAKPEMVHSHSLPSDDWTVFITDDATFKPLAFSTVAKKWTGSYQDLDKGEFGAVVAIHDIGLHDQIQKVIIGFEIDFWLNDIVAMDAISYLSHGRLSLELDRLLQVDIDDMFVGKVGIRTRVKDAEAMLQGQEKIRQYVPGFQFVMGFSGGMFLNGDDVEDKGDKKVVDQADEYIWFDHMFMHLQPHLLNYSELLTSMNKNNKFAEDHKIRYIKEYMVTPHHSGIYPVYEPLYDAWTKIRGVTTASSEQYPVYKPYWKRRGFIYRGVKVVPRQTCRLFTTTIFFEDYHGGKTELDISIKGGYLFKILLHTPVMVFMTHMSNYANDQLALYAFEKVTQFVNTWTNLKMSFPGPLEVARSYFDLYPQDSNPLWTNPCEDKRQMEIWPEGKSCSKLPKFVIVGPQKTGTTALLTFLEAHPNLLPSEKDPDYFEEVQFFNGKNYMNGLDWYMNHFKPPKDPNVVLYEKSANYFDNEITPKRMHALLPKAKIVLITTEPGRRAYSWYQHLRSHNDPVAMNHSFHQVVSASDLSPGPLKDTRNRCLRPGLYANHLARWLQFFPKSQIFLIDGQKLIKSPIQVMNRLQSFLKVQPFVDYSTKIRFDPDKGFYCLIDKGCLSPSKGRKYSAMEPEAASYLENYYRDHNTDLKTLLRELNFPFPQWLEESTS